MPATVTTMGVVLTPSGGSDDTTFVQGYLDTERCIAFKGTFPVTSLRVKYNEQVLSGIGSSHHTNTTEIDSARSAFKYVGSQWVSGATDDYTILRVEPEAANQALTGPRIDNIGFYGESKAARGLSMRSMRGSKVNVFVQATRDVGFYVGVVDTLAAGFRDPQWNTFEMIEVDQSFSGMGPCVLLDGDTVANTSVNNFEQIFARYNENDGVVIGDTDHNIFGLIRCLHSSLTPGYGLRLKGSSTSGSLVCRDNLILNASVSLGGCLSEGTESGATYPAANNTILFYDSTNGSTAPTIETGSTLWWRPPEQPLGRQMISGVLPA